MTTTPQLPEQPADLDRIRADIRKAAQGVETASGGTRKAWLRLAAELSEARKHFNEEGGLAKWLKDHKLNDLPGLKTASDTSKLLWMHDHPGAVGLVKCTDAAKPDSIFRAYSRLVAKEAKRLHKEAPRKDAVAELMADLDMTAEEAGAAYDSAARKAKDANDKKAQKDARKPPEAFDLADLETDALELLAAEIAAELRTRREQIGKELVAFPAPEPEPEAEEESPLLDRLWDAVNRHGLNPTSINARTHIAEDMVNDHLMGTAPIGAAHARLYEKMIAKLPELPEEEPEAEIQTEPEIQTEETAGDFDKLRPVIKTAKQTLKLSNAALGKIVGISPSLCGHHMTGERTPTPETQARYVAWLADVKAELAGEFGA
ncbi:hypothetical protein CEW88_11650 [Alloyangia pacifica]|uniref:Uncharacterized protein n=1 Tax=Alloyangia pacifica TaxID=311180 RepID=A0A2U8HEL7_9RHOB|nr:hypothetical protein [Alloyangia pacifica]AWI84282.1 hypothetical protein CEW88_11650 [Alloyangia pacifica]